METGKTGKYLKYAIGEIVLVVLGILIALSINNWNENRKQNIKHQQLRTSLIEDFEYNKSELKREIKAVDSMLNVIDTFYQLTASETQLVTVDSLRNLARAFTKGFNLNINLATYNQANSTGNLSLLNNNILLQEFTKFIDKNDKFNGLLAEGRYSYFNGSTWELRKTVDLNLIRGTNPLGDKITYTDYKSIISTPLAKAALINVETINLNILNHLNIMNKALEVILKTLKDMKAE